MTLYKVLDGKRAVNGGVFTYPRVGVWTPHIDGKLIPCERGYHLARDVQVLSWLGPTLYEAEACRDHPLVDGGDKMVSCRVRLVRKLNWDDRTARLFAADCAESALLGERVRGREPDERSWLAVGAARQFADGEITRKELAAAGAAGAAGAAAVDPLAFALSRIGQDHQPGGQRPIVPSVPTPMATTPAGSLRFQSGAISPSSSSTPEPSE